MGDTGGGHYMGVTVYMGVAGRQAKKHTAAGKPSLLYYAAGTDLAQAVSMATRQALLGEERGGG